MLHRIILILLVVGGAFLGVFLIYLGDRMERKRINSEKLAESHL